MIRAFKRWLSRFLPTCEEATLLMSKSIDTRLPLWDQLLMRLHQWTCLLCTRYDDQIHFVHRALRGSGEKVPQGDYPALSTEARDRIRKSLG